MQQQSYQQPPNASYYQQVPASLDDTILKGQQEIQKAVIKEQALNYERINLAQQKVHLQEYRKEWSKARYERLECETDGSFKLVVENPLVNMPDRQITNFRLVKVLRLISSDGDEGVFSGMPEH